MEKYVCKVCGWIYDPATGDPDGALNPEQHSSTSPTTGYARYAELAKTISNR